MGLFDWLKPQDDPTLNARIAAANQPQQPVLRTPEQQRFLAERGMRGLDNAVFGLFDMFSGAANSGRSEMGGDVRHIMPGTPSAQSAAQPEGTFPYASDVVANTVTPIYERATGRKLIDPSTMPEDVQKQGAIQETIAGMLPVSGPENMIGPLAAGVMATMPTLVRDVKGAKKIGGLIGDVARGTEAAAPEAKAVGGLIGDVAKSAPVQWAEKPPKGYQAVMGDVEKINSSLAKDSNMYVGPGGEGGIGKRYDKFGEFMAGDHPPVEPPMMSIGPYGEASVGNGRHRFAWMRDQGEKTMPVHVPDEYADEFRAKYGTEDVPQPGATVGDLNNPEVLFEGKSPHDFTPDQWYRFGKAHGIDNLGPEDAEAWKKSLVHYKSANGQDFSIPGGIDSKDPFTYYDLLHIKSQGINPNDMPPEMHQAIHDRMVKTMSPSGEVSPERLFNQFALAQISPNQPLTPNELAVARSMVKNPEDLKKWGDMIPWKHDDTVTPAQIMKNDDGSDMMRTVKYKDKKTGEQMTKQVPMTYRKYYGDKIANDLGLGAGDYKKGTGGLGARGTADYTRIAETAQRIRENPDFFRFRGAGEGGGTNAGDWANMVERITSQTPGLSAKTGSFGAVWQNPAAADISAVDRHMAGLFTEEMFPSKEAFQSFAQEHVDKFNAKAPASKQIKSFTQLPDTVKNDAMFGYLNQHPSMNLRNTQNVKGAAKGKIGPENMPVNPNVPAHLRPENADWVSDPKKVQMISDAYKRVLEANAGRANKVGQSTFANQWMLWDRIRNRLEPHEIMFPGLEKLPRMSMDQMRTARSELKNAGYMSSTKALIDEETGVAQKKLSPVRPMSNASKAAYFSLGGAGLLPLMMNMSRGEVQEDNGDSNQQWRSRGGA